MSPQDGSRQKLRNCVYICKSYAENTVASFFSVHGILYQRGSITSYASAGIARAEMFIHTLISTESK